jgi:hypothetical protein
VLFISISCSNNGSSNSSAKDSTNNSPKSVQPEDGQTNGSTYNPNPRPGDTVKTNQDSMQKKHRK